LKLRASLIICLLLIASLPVFPMNTASGDGEGWLSGYTDRIAHIINGSSSSQSDYQIKINVYYDGFLPLIGENYTKYGSNPLTVPESGYGSVHPDVLYFPSGQDGYKFWMYYEQAIASGNADIYLVRSNDGLTWTATGVSNPIISSHPVAGSHIPDPDVLKIGSTWYMWTGGYEPADRIFLWTSSDGKTWTSYSLAPVLSFNASNNFESLWVRTAAVIYNTTESKFYMWYTGYNGTVGQIGLAWSNNGYNWTKDYANNPVIGFSKYDDDSGGYSHINVVAYAGEYWMHAAGGHLFRSKDKISWVRSINNPVIKQGTGWENNYLYRMSWTQNATGYGQIINNQMQLYYSAREGSGNYGIGLANSSFIIDTDYSSINMNGTCKTDFGDIRFTSSDGSTELKYWIEKRFNGNWSVFWVKVPTIPASPSSTTIYMYWGNATASTTSNGDETFPIFIGHEEGTLAEWTEYGTATKTASTEHPLFSNYGLKLVPASGSPAGSGVRKTVSAYGSGYAYRIWLFDLDTSSYKLANYVGTFLLYDTGAKPLGVCFRETGDYYFYFEDGVGYVATSIARQQGHHSFEVAVTSAQSKIFIDNKLVRTTSVLDESSLNYVDAFVYRAYPNPTYFDNFLVRKFADPEPQHGAWVIEEEEEEETPFFGQGWTPPFSGFDTGADYPYNSSFYVTIDDDPTVRLNLPFQHCTFPEWDSGQSIVFYIKQYNATHWALGYSYSVNNIIPPFDEIDPDAEWSSFEPIYYVETDNFDGSKYDVLPVLVSEEGFELFGFLIVVLDDYSGGEDVRGSQKITLLLGNTTDTVNHNFATLEWQSVILIDNSDYYWFNPVIDIDFFPPFEGYWGFPIAVHYNETGSYLYGFISDTTDFTGAWSKYLIANYTSKFIYAAGSFAPADPYRRTYLNNVTQPQWTYYNGSGWEALGNITDRASNSYNFQTQDMLIADGFSEGAVFDAMQWFFYVDSTDQSLWVKFQNLTTAVAGYSDGGWINETLVTSMKAVHSPQLTQFPVINNASEYMAYFNFLWAKGDTVYMTTLIQDVNSSINHWAWTDEREVYTDPDLDESTLHTMQEAPAFIFINTGEGLQFGSFAEIVTVTPPDPNPPAPPPIYVRDAYNATYYFRSDTHTVHEVLGYILAVTNTRSEIIDSRSSSATEPVSYGVRVWVVDMFSQQHELTDGSPAVLITLNSPASGMQTGTWLCPKYSNIIDSLLIKIYQRFGSDPWSLRRIYVSTDHLYMKLPNTTWTFYLWLNMTQGSTTSEYGFGDYTVYNSRVSFQYYRISPWELGFVRLYAGDYYGFFFTPWTYILGDIFWSLLLFAISVSFYLRNGSWKPVLALLWILGGSGSILWALVPALNLHIAVLMLALALATTLYKALR